MKIFILILTIFSLSYSGQHTFLIDKYDEEMELEAKIIFDIATSSSSNKEIKLFIPKITDMEKKIYSKYFTLSENCEASNFVFVNKIIENQKLCGVENRLFFTNNYKKLLSDNKYYGAFFWQKSRPNIVFIKNRLEQTNILLPKSYSQFIEDF